VTSLDPSMPRAVILDFGGVMTEPFFTPRDHDDADLGALELFFLREVNRVYADVEVTHDLHLLETGRMSEADFFANLCDRAVEHGLARVEPQRARDYIVRRRLVACAAMVDAVRELRSAGYRTALLTNNAREWEQWWRPVVPLDELFDVVVDSSDVGLRKPGVDVYMHTCARLGVDPADCVFVDDLECNIDAARALGMEAILCDDPVRVAGELLARLVPQPG
jgi:putative hydrolase of the HAD superfamily